MHIPSRDGFSLLEVLLAVFLLTVGLLSICALIFHLQRQNFEARVEYTAHQILMSRLTEVQQEFSRSLDYLSVYGSGKTFTLPPEHLAMFGAATGTLTALSVGQPNTVLLEAALDYQGQNGVARNVTLGYLHRSEQP